MKESDLITEKNEDQTDHVILPQTHNSMYLMHKYWARKPANIVASYITRYTSKGDVVLDPFMGSGVSIIESIFLERYAIGVDINPIALFICEHTASLVDIRLLADAFEYVNQKIHAASSLFTKIQYIRCPMCDSLAEITHIIWKSTKIPKSSKKKSPKQPIIHKAIIDEVRISCPQCSSLSFEKKNFPLQFNQLSRELLKQENLALVELAKLGISPPKFKFQYSNQKNFMQLRHHLRKIPLSSELFTNRNLAVLSYLQYLILSLPVRFEAVQQLLLYCLTSAVGQASKMVWVINKRGGKSLQKRQVGSWTHHFFWDPTDFFEVNAWSCFNQRYSKILRGKKLVKTRYSNSLYPFCRANDFRSLSTKTPVLLLNQSCIHLPIPNESIDFVFTDPPYGDSIQYGELSSLWASWLNMNMKTYMESIETDEIIMNSNQNKTLSQYRSQLLHAFTEIFRVLKRGKFMVVTFHNTSLKIRNTLIETIINAGFSLKQIVFQLPPRVSIKSMLHHSGSPIGDYYIRFLKRTQIPTETPKEKSKKTPYSQWDPFFLDELTLQPRKSHIFAKLQAIITKILTSRGEPTLEIWVSNLLDEELFKEHLFPLPAIQEYLDNFLTEAVFIRDSQSYWWFPANSIPTDVKSPLKSRIEVYLTHLLRDINFRDHPSTKKQILFNSIYMKFRGILTPDKFQINQLIEAHLQN